MHAPPVYPTNNRASAGETVMKSTDKQIWDFKKNNNNNTNTTAVLISFIVWDDPEQGTFESLHDGGH